MNASDRRRLGLAWGASVALAALAGALSAWLFALPAPVGAQAVAVRIGAAVAAVLAVALAGLSLRRLAAAPAGPARPRSVESAGTVDGQASELGSADTRPAVWSDTLDPVNAAAGAPPASPAPGRPWVTPAAFDEAGAIDPEAAVAATAEDGASASPDGIGPETPPGRPPASGGGAVHAPDTLQHALRQALDAGEMRLVYQPIFDLEARRVHAVEALLRWPRAAKALLPTEDIVAIADRGGFGADLTRFVLAGASQQIVRWHQVLGAAAPARVCINLSRQQCLADALLDDFEHELDAHGLSADAFQFELAERDVAADTAVEVRLHELRALGATVALDRFGEANASLAGLQRLPVDTIKVNRHLIGRAETGGTVRMVLESTLGLARELGLEVVFEGVETTKQLALLRTIGCRLAQGHALCPPMDPFALTRRLRGGHWLTEAVRDDPTSTASGS